MSKERIRHGRCSDTQTMCPVCLGVMFGLNCAIYEYTEPVTGKRCRIYIHEKCLPSYTEYLGALREQEQRKEAGDAGVS